MVLKAAARKNFFFSWCDDIQYSGQIYVEKIAHTEILIKGFLTRYDALYSSF